MERMCEEYCGDSELLWRSVGLSHVVRGGETIVVVGGETMKKSKSKFCSHCGDLIPEGKEFIEFKGSHFHDDKVTIENLGRKLIEINSITNDIPSKIDREGILKWCDSVEKQFQPREVVPRGEVPKVIEEQFLATGIRYLRALCGEEK